MENSIQLDREKNIRINIGTNLFISVEGVDSSIKSILVGIKNDEYIVVTPPSPSISIEQGVLQKEMLTVTYLFEGKIYYFQSKIIERVFDPVELIVLEHPKSIQVQELRSHKRINCFISANVEIKNGGEGEVINGVIKDISKTGCRFLFQASKSGKNPFRTDERIILTCHFPGIKNEQEALGTIKDIQITGESITVGIQFSDVAWWVPPYSPQP